MQSKYDKERFNKKRQRDRDQDYKSVWVEKELSTKETPKERDDWMAMTGQLKTYTKDDVKPKREDKNKKNIDSYNPATSSRELNPYWKHGGTGVPLASQSTARKFLVDDDDEDYYTNRKSDHHHKSRSSHDSCTSQRSNWKKASEHSEPRKPSQEQKPDSSTVTKPPVEEKPPKQKDHFYLSDEKMNKIAAKIIKAEILGDMKQAAELKAKLEAARDYRKQNPDAGKEEDSGIMLMTTTSSGNSRPLSKGEGGDPRSRGGKRKADTHDAGQRTKYFGNDDKYNLSQMFEQEKYGSNYDDQEELAKIAAKHTNPNDDLEDIFMDEISKNRSEAKDKEKEKQRAISQHKKMEKSLEGCQYCLESKNMLKHMMVSCGNKVYLSLPSRKSLVKGHCFISTIQHSTCSTTIDEDVWEEIMDFRKALTKFFDHQDMDVVFFETASKLHKFPHMVINCVPLPRDVGDMAAIYFKKALLECEAEWSMNKKVVDLRGKNIRKAVPKGLPYFWIDFGMQPGFAHVIEDQQLFPNNFAEEIIGGMLDLNHNLWKNPQKEYGDVQRKKVLDFLMEWKTFDTVSKK